MQRKMGFLAKENGGGGKMVKKLVVLAVIFGVLASMKVFADTVYLRDEKGRFREPQTFWEQLQADTRKEFGRSWNVGHVFGAIGAQNRFSAGTTLVAWKFVAVDGAVTYSPIESNRKADFEFQFPIRIERVPIGDGMELGDLFYRKDRVNGWYDHSVMRLLLSHSPTSGLFGFGFRISLEY